MSIIQEFKEFAVKGNMMDMAIGVIIGGAFGKIIDSLVKDIIMPLNTFFPYLNEVNFICRVVTCPVIYMPVFDKTYRIASHCELLEQIRNILKLCSLIIWSFISLRIVLSS